MLSKKEISRLFKSVKEYKTEELIDILTQLADYVAESEERRDKAIKQVKEFNKDEEIVKLKKQLEQKENQIKNSRTFVILPEEIKAIEEWQEQHTKEKHGGNEYAGAIGGRYSYKFTPTSIGTFGSIVCSCGEKFDFADGSNF
jgi:hypothetical protein